MNLDEIKTLSEIFNNFAQPIATVIVALIGAKIITFKKNKQLAGKELPQLLPHFIQHITITMNFNVKLVITFLGIILTLYKPLWFLGCILMFWGIYLIYKEDKNGR